MQKKNEPITINIRSTRDEVVSAFLQIYLARERLTGRQLDVTRELVNRYTEYVLAGVNEPYASKLLFSTDTRKEICTKLKLSGPHLTNTLRDLVPKNIIGKGDDEDYVMNPFITPTNTLVFNFEIVDKQ